ncbi:hypothetical protein TNCV_193631 [Trichonephila clavipes]|nr:hypothetical protein TNCV_193631 [Trichonephila clavipes]
MKPSLLLIHIFNRLALYSTPHHHILEVFGKQEFGSVKFHLKRVLGETILTFEELTFAHANRRITNSRPLSYVNYFDIECISTLTPSHFLQVMLLLQFQRSFLQPPTTEIVESCYRTSNGAFGRSGARIYLLLTTSQEMAGRKPNLNEDDIVLIKEEGPPWYMANGSSSFWRIQATTDWFVLQTVKPKTQCLNDLFINFTNFFIYPN